MLKCRLGLAVAAALMAGQASTAVALPLSSEADVVAKTFVDDDAVVQREQRESAGIPSATASITTSATHTSRYVQAAVAGLSDLASGLVVVSGSARAGGVPGSSWGPLRSSGSSVAGFNDALQFSIPTASDNPLDPNYYTSVAFQVSVAGTWTAPAYGVTSLLLRLSANAFPDLASFAAGDTSRRTGFLSGSPSWIHESGINAAPAGGSLGDIYLFSQNSLQFSDSSDQLTRWTTIGPGTFVGEIRLAGSSPVLSLTSRLVGEISTSSYGLGPRFLGDVAIQAASTFSFLSLPAGATYTAESGSFLASGPVAPESALPGLTPTNPVLPTTPAPGGGWEISIPPASVLIPPGCLQDPSIPLCRDIQQRRGGWFDPEIATGYRYEISDPGLLFTGVDIPYAYGDGVFDLYLWDTSQGMYVDSGRDVLQGQYFDFLAELGIADGLNHFALYGIEESAMVDPNDPQGFVTGLTFAGLGDSFSMIPITVTTSVPEPQTLALLIGGLGLISWGARRRVRLQ